MCCLFQALGCAMGQYISLCPARRRCPSTSAGGFQHPPKPLSDSKHPLTSCCLAPKAKYTYFIPLLTPLAAAFLPGKGHCSWQLGFVSVEGSAGFPGLLNRGISCRLAPSLTCSPWGFSLVGKETLIMGRRDGVLAVPGAIQKGPSTSVCIIASEQPYTGRKGKSNSLIIFLFFTIFLIGPWKSERTSGKCLERAVTFNTVWGSRWMHPASPLSGHSRKSVPQTCAQLVRQLKETTVATHKLVFCFLSASCAAWVIFVRFPC